MISASLLIETESKRLAALQALLSRFPDLCEHRDRWKTPYLVSSQLPPGGNWQWFTKRDCGCCENASEMILVYQDFPEGRVFAVQTMLYRRDAFGQRAGAYQGWREELARHGVPPHVLDKIGQIRMVEHEPPSGPTPAEDEAPSEEAVSEAGPSAAPTP